MMGCQLGTFLVPFSNNWSSYFFVLTGYLGLKVMSTLRQRSLYSSKAFLAACSSSLCVRLSTSSKVYYLLSNTEF